MIICVCFIMMIFHLLGLLFGCLHLLFLLSMSTYALLLEVLKSSITKTMQSDIIYRKSIDIENRSKVGTNNIIMYTQNIYCMLYHFPLRSTKINLSQIFMNFSFSVTQISFQTLTHFLCLAIPNKTSFVKVNHFIYCLSYYEYM